MTPKSYYREGTSRVELGAATALGFRLDLEEQPIVKLEQAFHDNLGVANHGHEVRISVPAGNNMPVQVSGKTCARRFPLIETNVISLGPQHPAKYANHPSNRFDRLQQVWPGKFLHGSSVQARCNKEMAVVVWVTVQDHRGMMTTPDQQVGAVIASRQSLA